MIRMGNDAVELGGFWEYKLDPDNKGFNGKWFESNLNWNLTVVPGAWNIEEPDDFYYEGIVWYRKKFTSPDDFLKNRSFVKFQGVNYLARVWLNGIELGTHAGGHIPFRFEATNVIKKESILVVRVDNFRKETRAPSVIFDWFNYGGICRRVLLESYPLIFVTRVVPVTKLDKEGAKVLVNIYIDSNSSVDTEINLILLDKEEPLCKKKLKVKVTAHKETKVAFNLFVKAPKLWSPEYPYLYTLQVNLSSGHTFRQEIGIREIRIEGRHILLNKSRFIVRGINRHEEHPNLGNTLPLALVWRDLMLLKKLNINCIRSHYPPDPVVLKIANRIGLFFLVEIPSYGTKKKNLEKKEYVRTVVSQWQETIREYSKYTSILAWSVCNEPQSDIVEARKFIKRLIEEVKRLDYRPVTFASYYKIMIENDCCSDLVDFVSVTFNAGWYNYEAGETKVIQELQGILHKLSLKTSKPIVIAEFSAGAILGYHSLEKVRWSEEYQEYLLKAQLELLKKNEDIISGGFIWQFHDNRVMPSLAITRPREFNNKGIMDGYRNPKMAYHMIKKFFHNVN